MTLQIFIVASIFPFVVQAQDNENPNEGLSGGERDLITQLELLAWTDSGEFDQWTAVAEAEEPTPEPMEEESTTEPVVETAPVAELMPEEHDAAEDILDLFWGDFEYAGPEVIEVPLATIEDTSVVIKTTKILYDGEDINQYRVYYSTNTIADFLDVNDLKEVDLNVENTMENMVELSLKDLDPSTTYFLIIAPVDPTDTEADPLELISEEVTFKTKASTPVPTITESTLPAESWPAANGMYVDDVSYTYANNKATVTWTAMEEASTIALSIKKSNSTTYTKLADVPATAGKYTFTVQEWWLHLLKVETKNANGEVFGKEQIQSIKIDEVTVIEDVVKNAPQVGPAQNLLYGLIIFAMLMWVGVNFRKQEA